MMETYWPLVIKEEGWSSSKGILWYVFRSVLWLLVWHVSFISGYFLSSQNLPYHEEVNTTSTAPFRVMSLNLTTSSHWKSRKKLTKFGGLDGRTQPIFSCLQMTKLSSCGKFLSVISVPKDTTSRMRRGNLKTEGLSQDLE
jgi:hypothetical protein